MLQGIPVGLAFGSIPFLLRAKLSYSQIGIFTLCTYPYSLKLLWSPIVDSIFSPKLGRRKSWIVPIQTIVGLMMWWMANNVASLLDVDEPNVNKLTVIFFTLVFFAATQDIAVDGQSCFGPGPEGVASGGGADSGVGCRVGSNAPFQGQPVVRLDRPDRWTQHWLLPLIHRLPRLQLGRVLVSCHRPPRRFATSHG
jgi:hypothetical protein